MRMQTRLALFALTFAAALVGTSAAASSPGPTELVAGDADLDVGTRWRIGVGAGVSVYLNTQSSALPHVYDPVVRAHGLYVLDERLSLGVEVSAIASDNENYRLIGGYMLARLGLVRSSGLRFDLRFGAGLGTSPRIVATDLQVEETVAPWAQLGLELAWRATPEIDVWFGLVGEHLGVVSLVGGVELGL